MRFRRAWAALAAASALLLAGCQDPYATDPKAGRDPASPRAPRAGDGDRTGPAAAALRTAPLSPAPTARAAASRFALGWVNWDWRTAPAQQRRLASLATGQLAGDLRSGAQSARVDRSLARDKPGSRGTVVAVELHGTGGSTSGLVVTREETYTAGHANLGGNHYRVYLVRIVRAGGGWGVSRWAPQQ